MKIQIIITVLLTTISQLSYSQCETYEIPLTDTVNTVAMTEKIYQNEDLENGAKTFYISFNSIPTSSDKTESLNSLVVTYMSTRSNFWITPNTLTIGFPSGEVIKLKASSKSSQTFNLYKQMPSTSKSIECFYILDYDTILKIIGEEKISYLYISDYKTDNIFDVTPNYKGLLSEMLRCVLNL